MPVSTMAAKRRIKVERERVTLVPKTLMISITINNNDIARILVVNNDSDDMTGNSHSSKSNQNDLDYDPRHHQNESS